MILKSCNTAVNLIITCGVVLVFFCTTVSAICANGDDDWECDNGQCIASYEKCDGSNDCSDGSDELVDICVSNTECPYLSFRCTYGACIKGSSECNNVTDCHDGSDESPWLCLKKDEEIEKLELERGGKCSDPLNSMQCTSGECISSDQVCDGQSHCRDGSDETVQLCANTYCPGLSFRCGYGACITGNLKCDGKKHCRDGSDEASSVCNTTRIPSQMQTTMPTPTIGTTTTVQPTKVDINVPNEGCMLPNDEHMIVKTIHLKRVLQIGTKVGSNVLVLFECFPTYALIGERMNLCAGTAWSKSVPQCVKLCNTTKLANDGLSTTVLCQAGVRCENELVPPNTKVSVTCKYGYHYGYESNVNPTLTCRSDGKWNRKRTPCKINCGTVENLITQFALGSTKIKVSHVPWTASIYNNYFSDRYEYNCGGTIVSVSWIVSAAHCFWDDRGGGQILEMFYKVAVGKQRRDLQLSDPGSRIFNVKKIIPHTSFNSHNLDNDIAMVKVDGYMDFSKTVNPICVFYKTDADSYIPTGLNGTFASFGITDNNLPADTLQSVLMRTISYHDCDRRLKELGLKFTLPRDKFCLEGPQDQLACKGDSGSGFILNGEKNEIVGIVSHVPREEAQCSRDNILVMTNIHYQYQFIGDRVYEDELLL